MNTYQLVNEALGGFVAGIAVSRYAARNRDLESKIDYCLTLAPAKMRETMREKGITQETRDRFKSINTKLHFFLPYIGGVSYAALSTIVSLGQWKFAENMVVALPSVYLGYAVGAGINSFIVRKQRKELAIAKAIQEKPETLESYLSPDEKQKIEQALAGAEQEIAEGTHNPVSSPHILALHRIVSAHQEVYAPLIYQWSLQKYKETVSLGSTQQKLRNFYDDPSPLAGTIACGVLLGEEVQGEARVFRKQGNMFYIDAVAWKDFGMIEREQQGIEVIGTSPTVHELKQQPWNADYHSLARLVEKEGKGYWMILMHAPETTSRSVRAMILTNTYVDTMIAKHQRGNQKRR